ncbi:MAG TPA: valine--tRNA ligase [Myxococcota bacterium]|nr:valine--tRNA ligase [Myxococcota bacterium]
MAATGGQLPTRFEAKPAESRWYRLWLARGLFRASAPGPGEPPDPRPRFSMVIPPPNITGSLHVGHALNNTLQDLLARHRRLQGMNVLWMPGTDHAGISTQVVVEKEIAKAGKTRHDLGREAFVDLVWEWKARYGARIVEQLQALGCSCDWSRERFTMDPGLSRAVREVFVRLYHQGLIYRSEYLVSWCPRCSTVLSDLESPHRPVSGKLYAIRYPLVDGTGELVVETTRPETLLGDTAVAVHPEDARWRAVVGKQVRLPLLGREIPIVSDAFVDREFGTGVVKVTPAHDPHDFDCARRLGLPAINILHPDATLNENAGPYAGLSVSEARKRVVADLEAAGLLVGVKDHPHEVPHCDRCDTLVQPLLSEQWFMRMEPLARPAIEAVREGRVRFHPASWENTYFHWMENIRDWAISRQLWWGHRIPAWRCASCAEWTVELEDPERCSHCGSAAIVQESDVLDTWFSSALWPFSTLGWPEDTPELRAFYPTSVLSTAFDIIFFWVARMIMMGLHFMGDVPFRDVYIHPLVRDEKGRKMSKSKGIGIDPLEVMDVYGTDAVRWTLTSLAAQGRDIRFGVNVVDGGRAFVTKLWNAARFALLNLGDYEPARAPLGSASLYDRWIRTRLDAALSDAHRAIDAFRFNDAANALYQFVWGELCDWYIELAKQQLQATDQATRAPTQRTLVEVLAGALVGLHPVMPFVTEEILQALPTGDSRLALERGYPSTASPLSENEASEMHTLVEVVTRVRQVRGELGLAPSTRVQVGFPTAALPFVERHAAGLRALVGAGELRFDDGPAPATAAVVQAGGYLVRVELSDPSFLGDELRRLEKAQKTLEKELAISAKKLDNPDFLARAKEDVVEAERDKRARLETELKTTRERISRLRQILGADA